MPRTLTPIPVSQRIVGDAGSITTFFRLRWQELVDSFAIPPTVAGQPDLAFLGKTAALGLTTLYLTPTSALFQVDLSVIRTLDDGVSSSLAITLAWTYRGVAKTHLFPALTELVAGVSTDGIVFPVYADANTAIQVSTTYASNTANRMTYDIRGSVKQDA